MVRSCSSWHSTYVVRRLVRGTPGFSLLELLVIVALIAVLAALAQLAVGNALAAKQADAAMYQVLNGLQQSRQVAQAVRRNVEVQFVGTNQLRTSRLDGATATVLALATFENGAQYRQFSGVPDTPDAFGATSATSFGSATRIFFTTDGSLIDQSGVPVNGTIFLGVQSKPLTARAITILGASGHIQLYRWTGTLWR
jgi:Tfp pilus assembly protein FimT